MRVYAFFIRLAGGTHVYKCVYMDSNLATLVKANIFCCTRQTQLDRFDVYYNASADLRIDPPDLHSGWTD